MFEWLAHNLLWKEPPAVAMEKEFKMQRVRFGGCALGLRASAGAQIRKPWAFSTNSPTVQIRLAAYLCDG